MIIIMPYFQNNYQQFCIIAVRGLWNTCIPCWRRWSIYAISVYAGFAVTILLWLLVNHVLGKYIPLESIYLNNYIIFAKLPRYEMYLTLFYFWTSLASLDVSSSNEVTDFGIQNLIFPPTIISSRGSLNNGVKVNLTNTRARTSNVAKVLQVNKRLVWARWSEVKIRFFVHCSWNFLYSFLQS